MTARSDNRGLAGRVVAVTGGARGVGRATANELLERGAFVAVGDIDGELARETAKTLGHRAAAFDLDVCDRESFGRFLSAVEGSLGPLDVLVNNAGILATGSFLDEPLALTERQIQVNLVGVAIGMKLALPGMLARGRGHVVNVASLAGKSAIAGEATYSASKHGVVGLTHAVRMELADSPIHMSLVLPAVIATDMARGMSAGRGRRQLTPESVARAIVDVLEHPRLEVSLPRGSHLAFAAATLLPWKLRRQAAHVLGLDAIGYPDASARSDYEARIRTEESA